MQLNEILIENDTISTILQKILNITRAYDSILYRLDNLIFINNGKGLEIKSSMDFEKIATYLNDIENQVNEGFFSMEYKTIRQSFSTKYQNSTQNQVFMDSLESSLKEQKKELEHEISLKYNEYHDVIDKINLLYPQFLNNQTKNVMPSILTELRDLIFNQLKTQFSNFLAKFFELGVTSITIKMDTEYKNITKLI